MPAPIQFDTEALRESILADVRNLADDPAKYLTNERIDEKNRELEAAEAPDPALLISKAEDPRLEELQTFNDDVYIMSRLLRSHPEELRYFRKRARSMRRLRAEVRKAMDTVDANEGKDWVPSGWSQDIQDRIRLGSVVMSQFGTLEMTAPDFKFLTLKADASAYLLADSTSDTPTAITASTIQSDKIQFTSKGLKTRVLVSGELSEDAVTAMLPFIKDTLVTTVAYAEDDAALNGDTAGTHMDFDVTGSTDPRKAWDGLRKMAQGANDVTLTNPVAIGDIRSMRAKMGKYGTNPRNLVLFCSVKGLYKLEALAEFKSLDQLASGTPIRPGQVGSIDGIAVVVSEKMRDDVASTGVNTMAGPNDKSVLLMVYAPAILRGVLNPGRFTDNWDEQTDQRRLVLVWRGDFKSWVDVTSQPVVVRGKTFVV